MSSLEGLRAELESLKDRLADAIDANDESKIKYLEERIYRVEKEIENKEYYDSKF